ncbi:putative programmed cell death protein [Helianthus annuus]|nr:putative programmed cell death protein [Helianthus annuus]
MAAAREGFLTDEQREVLKTATQSTEVLSSSPKSPSWLMAEHQIKAPAGERAPNVGIAVRHVRRSHSGKLVRVKKDGGGGKGTWGKLLDTDGEPHIDRNDPNYDSGEEPYQLVGSAVSDPLDEYKRKVASIIDEYFTTGDVDLAASELRDLGSSEYHPYFIKRLVSMAMDRHDKEKEMASVLLSALYSDVISSTQIKQGFFMLLESADDLAVDILDTVETLALFVARGVVDDILPPAFALVMAMEKKNDRMLDLLQECYSEGLITTNQMTKGFGRVEDGLDDLALDIPDAVDKFKGYQEHAVVRGWLVSV